MSGEYVPVKVHDASVRECVMYANLNLRGLDTNQIGTHITVEISQAYDAWLTAHNARIASEAAEKARELAAERDVLAGQVERVQTALDSHPACDVHPDDDPITCGWKRVVADVTKALDSAGGGAE